MKNFDIEKLSSSIEQFSKDRSWDQFHSIKNLSMALSVEASELMEIFQWLTEDQSNQLRHDPALLRKTEEEIADIAIYLIRILQKTGINLEEAINRKLEKNAEKYPIELSKGNAAKYTDLK